MPRPQRARQLTIVSLLLAAILVPFALMVLVLASEDDAKPPRRHFAFEFTLRLDDSPQYAALRSDVFRDHLGAGEIGLDLEHDRGDPLRRLQAMQRGEAQLAVFRADQLLQANAQLEGTPAQIVAVLAESDGAEALAAHEDALPYLDGLAAPEVRLVQLPGSRGAFMARAALPELGLGQLLADALELEDSAALAEQLRAPDRSLPRVYALQQPLTARAQGLEIPQILFESSRLQGYLLDLLVVENGFLNEHPQAVQAALGAWFHATSQLAEQGGAEELLLQDRRQRRSPLEPVLVDELAASMRWVGAHENFARFGLSAQGHGLLPLEDCLRNVGDLLPDLAADGPFPIDRSSLAALQASSDASPSAEPAALPTPLPALPAGRWDGLAEHGRLPVEPVLFAAESDQPTADGQARLRQVARRLRGLPGYYVTVLAATPPDSGPQGQARALRRAQAVVHALRQAGVNAARIRAATTQQANEAPLAFVLSRRAR